MTLAVALPIAVTFFGIIIAAAVSLYLKRLDRRNEVESRHSATCEAAYDQLLAAGDVIWFYRTKKALHPESVVDVNEDAILLAAAELANTGMDRLQEYSSDFEARTPTLTAWLELTYEDNVSPRSFENAREAVLNLRRQETGLRKHIRQTRQLSFFERLRQGQVVQRMPEGINQIIRTTDNEIIVTGDGDQIMQFMHEVSNLKQELQASHDIARSRFNNWRERGVWTFECN